MLRRAAVYRDVAVQVRLLGEDAALSVTARPRRVTRAPLSNLAPVSPIVVQAVTRAPRVRAAFLDALVDAIAKRRRAGWSVARLTLWLRTTLRDPQMDGTHPCARRPFVAYVTSLLTVPAAPLAA
jgi:hypothetical protein